MEDRIYTGICAYCGKSFYVDRLTGKVGYTNIKPKNVNERMLKCCFPYFTKPQDIEAKCSSC